MRLFNLTRKLFWVIAAFIIAATILITFYLYHQAQRIVETRALARAHTLQTYFASMRYVYHRQFLGSGLDLNDSTIGFLPAHAAALISDEFSRRMPDGTTIRNVSDRPRNPLNQADEHERRAIERFARSPGLKETFSTINQNNTEYFFYAAPMKIEPYCIQCHGHKEEVNPYIARRYDTAYGYKIGDIRGITSIKVPKHHLDQQSMSIFWKEVVFGWSIILFLLGIIYYAIRELTFKDAESKKQLQLDVIRKTAELSTQSIELDEAYQRQQYLFSILRTLSDTNQILLTAQSLDELISSTADSLVSNTAFLCVIIALVEEEELRIKALRGIDEKWTVLPIDLKVLQENHSRIITDFKADASEECRNRAEKLGLTALYVTPLRKDGYPGDAFGVMTICTTRKQGFGQEEKMMIDELSGDLGYAINAFYHKENILKLSYYDSLTELPNRYLLMERCTQAMKTSARTLQYGALLFIDLDNFKSINDIKGHLSGDNVLKRMGHRLRMILRQSDTVSRFGGDEFVVLIENIGTDHNNAAKIAQQNAQKILDIAKEPFIIDDEPFYLTASVGIVLFDGEEITTNNLFAYADSAMYAAKNNGRNTLRFYDAALQETMALQAKMLQDLRAAVERHALHLAYQEQVDHQGETVGVEVLLRWEHPEKGSIPPSQFIPLAEESGVIVPLGRWILEQAVKQLSCWSTDPGRRSWRLSVNVSPKQFEQEDFVSQLKDLIYAAHIDPAKLRLELTEGLLIRDAEQAMAKINELKAIGFTLSIDDFGTGYSSLSYLKHLPIDELKIDQSFVKALPESNSDQTIIRTMIAIAEAFGLEVIAEGVETSEQFEALRNMGCSLFQGYFFSYPKRADLYLECGKQ